MFSFQDRFVSESKYAHEYLINRLSGMVAQLIAGGNWRHEPLVAVVAPGSAPAPTSESGKAFKAHMRAAAALNTSSVVRSRADDWTAMTEISIHR